MKKLSIFVVFILILCSGCQIGNLKLTLENATATPTMTITPPTPSPTEIPTSIPTPTPSPKPSSDEIVAAKGILAIKTLLKNPESLQINGIKIWSGIGVYFDVSAQNGFGGMNRQMYFAMDNVEDSPFPDFECYHVKKYNILVVNFKELNFEDQNYPDLSNGEVQKIISLTKELEN